MKKLKLIIRVFLFITIIASCKKEETDDRDNFIGTWKGTETSSIISGDINSSNTSPVTLIITKRSDNSKQISLNRNGVSTTANVNGNTYTYDLTYEYGVDIYWRYIGTGTRNGKVITESGTMKSSVLGYESTGSFTSNLTKQ